MLSRVSLFGLGFVRAIAFAFVALFSILIASAAESEPKWAKVGDGIPDVSVVNESGEPVRLRSLVSQKPTILVFYRGGWCPYCNRHLSALAEIEPKILQSGYQILALSPDQPKKLKETPNRDKLGYQLFSDRKAEVAQALGIAWEVAPEMVAKYKNQYKVDLEGAAGDTHHLLPHPALFVVGTDGLIRFSHVDPNFKMRLTPEEVLAAIGVK